MTLPTFTLPTLSNNTKIITSVIALTTAFAMGRYSVDPPSTKVEVQDLKTEVVNQDKAVETHKKTTVTKKPDGTITFVTTIDSGSDTKIDTTSTDELKSTTTVSQQQRKTLNISVLGANDFSRGLLVPTYGLAIHKEVLGPFTVGAFGLMNGAVGVSIGLDF